jgi:hypothetical protein
MRTLFTILFALFSLRSIAQEVEGMVIHDKTLKPIGDVLVANKRTSETAYSDSNGRYRISAVEGDLLLFYRIGYQSRRETAHIVRGKMTTIAMPFSELQLDEVLVRGSTYKMDSIERTIIYGRGLRDAKKKVYVTLTNGIVFHNLPSQFAKRVTGRLKQEKRFLRLFEEGEKEKFIATRYNMAVVKKVTGLDGDDAAHFMNANPIDYEFARKASELELVMWVSSSYKLYSNKRK